MRDRREGPQSFYGLVADALPAAVAHLPRRGAAAGDPTLEGDQARLRELDAERRGDVPERFAGEMERHYSPGRTWQSLAVGHRRAAAARRRARRRLGRRRGGGGARAVLPLAHLHRHERAPDRGRDASASRGTPTCARQVADAHELPFGDAQLRLGRSSFTR